MNKIIIPSTFYSVSKDEWNEQNYCVYWQNSEKVWQKWLEDENIEIVFNLDSKKDRRKEENKIKNPIVINITNLVALNNHNINSNFTINQDKNSIGLLNFYLNNLYDKKDKNLNQDSKNKLCLNGRFETINISSADFEEIVIDGGYTSNNNENKQMHSTNWNFSEDKAKVVRILNQKQTVNLGSLVFENCEKIEIKNCKRISFEVGENNLKLKSIKELNLGEVDEINIDFKDYIFTAFRKKADDWSKQDKYIEEQINEIKNVINLDSKIILKADGSTKCERLLPENSKEQWCYHKWLNSEIWPNKIKNGKIILTPIEFIQGMWNKDRLETIDKFNRIEKMFENAKKNKQEIVNDIKTKG